MGFIKHCSVISCNYPIESVVVEIYGLSFDFEDENVQKVTINNISSDQQRLKDLGQLIERSEISKYHIFDIIDDFLSI